MTEESASAIRREVTVPAGKVTLAGELVIPPVAGGVIVFAHGSGSGRQSPRNNFVAGVLHGAGFATMLLDLLTEEEAEQQRFVFDIDLLAERLLYATRWLEEVPETVALQVGYFGASTGAGAALQAAAREPGPVKAIVSRGGRPDLAAPFLLRVKAPTLLIVGGSDSPVITLNREALALLAAPKQMEIVPGAGHLFEEPGALEEVASLASDWFQRFLRP